MRFTSMFPSDSATMKKEEVLVITKEGERAESDVVSSTEREARLKKVYRKVDKRLVIMYGVLFVLVKASGKSMCAVWHTTLTQ